MFFRQKKFTDKLEVDFNLKELRPGIYFMKFYTGKQIVKY